MGRGSTLTLPVVQASIGPMWAVRFMRLRGNIPTMSTPSLSAIKNGGLVGLGQSPKTNEIRFLGFLHMT
jgi:hypothetical protein